MGDFSDDEGMADGIAIEEISDGKGLLTAEVVGGGILHALTVTLRLGETRDVVLGLADIGNYFRRRDAEFAPPKSAFPTFSVQGDTLIVEYPNGEVPDNYIFFNLKGHGVGNIEDHNLTIFADRFAVGGKQFCRTGRSANNVDRKKGCENNGEETQGWCEYDVTGTPLDFRKETPIGERIRVGFEPLVRQKGYDHIFILDKSAEQGFEAGSGNFGVEGEAKEKTDLDIPLTHAATLMDRMRTLQMDVYTSFPALHLCTGNRMGGRDIGKGGCIYPKRGGVALMPCGLPWEKATGNNRVIYRFTTKETAQ